MSDVPEDEPPRPWELPEPVPREPGAGVLFWWVAGAAFVGVVLLFGVRNQDATLLLLLAGAAFAVAVVGSALFRFAARWTPGRAMLTALAALLAFVAVPAAALGTYLAMYALLAGAPPLP